MAFFRAKDTIEEGDLVVVCLSRDNMVPITVNASVVYNNKFGNFAHANMIGMQYGSKMYSHNGRGYVHLLFPTPELWTLIVPHRTQILYLPDISFISAYLDLVPGRRVLECGTGSGSFSHSIARSIAPNGHLYSFEYHEKRYEIAKAEFEQHGIADLITLQHRDVLKDGFALSNAVQAVFLDLPAPWDAIASAKEAFDRLEVGRLCSFSPCIEQVQRTCQALADHGFTDIRMFEVLIRDHDLRSMPHPTIQSAIARHRSQIEAKALAQQQRAASAPQANGHTEPTTNTGEETKKRKATDALAETTTPDGHDLSLRPLTDAELHYTLMTKTEEECRGHTSYLTFATLIPAADTSPSMMAV
ncbi:tRNA (adenine-N(1)-)-methyltransferase catalytic subunit trm61 [Dimargaris verticillata]|uniref:tRNA (adenine(58)-N(1))-methyltransferase catalytic subunit TRM61 n=1 Tax=Dimargaris verticillata TaxID=2761393 RepID=A0A9W8B1B1_9FUNG|nr:tRNA (adenine-N(1)-)-methyltransferase catalytic subunit trm61 [Dimargaris verticillata]